MLAHSMYTRSSHIESHAHRIIHTHRTLSQQMHTTSHAHEHRMHSHHMYMCSHMQMRHNSTRKHHRFAFCGSLAVGVAHGSWRGPSLCLSAATSRMRARLSVACKYVCMYVCMYSTCLSVASLLVCMHACMYVFYLRSPGDHMCELALRLAARRCRAILNCIWRDRDLF